MKLHVETAPGELGEKAPLLVKNLLGQLADVDPRIQTALEALEKAEQDPLSDQGPLRYAVLRELFMRKRRAYEHQLGLMMQEVEALLSR